VGLDPLPAPELWRDLYSDAYFEAYSVHHAPTRGYLHGRQAAEESGRRRLKALAGVVPGGRLLDIGCAGGHFLSVARAFGYEVAGIEYNVSMARVARERGFDVLQGDVMQVEIPGRFDVIHMEDVLEHLPDPHSLLGKVVSALAPGGVVVVDGPLEAQSCLGLLPLRLNRRIRRIEDPEVAPAHLWLYSWRTQRRLLERAGLEEVWVRVYEDAKPPIPMTGSWGKDLRRGAVNALQRVSTAVSNNRWLRILGLGDRGLFAYAPAERG
jgi:SAM-dependent methyltransferase